jgi:hypothetical protein
MLITTTFTTGVAQDGINELCSFSNRGNKISTFQIIPLIQLMSHQKIDQLKISFPHSIFVPLVFAM